MNYSETAYRDINRKRRAGQAPISYIKRDIEERICDFEEVIVGYDNELAIAEASRCIQCPSPQACTLNCPAGNDIPLMLWLASEGDFVAAGQVMAETSPLPEVCGRVCPNLCQEGCVLGTRNGAVSIGKLEAFVADKAREAGRLAISVAETKSGKHVAVVGSGPAGITVAQDLIQLGHQVTVYEAWPKAGGVLVYGIPGFKLDKHLVQKKITDLESVGVRFITNTRIGEDVQMDQLTEEYDAIFLGTGAGVEATMNIPGEDLTGVFSATDYLVRANVPLEWLPEGRQERPKIGKRVAIVGGGDTAVDCARSSIRLGAEEVTIVYRRTEAEMPGNAVERGVCVEEGTTINYLQAPVEIIGDDSGVVTGMKIVRMELGEPDDSGRRRPVKVEGSEFVQEVDNIIMAIGYWPDPLLGKSTEGLETHKWGLIKADEEDGKTSLTGVFAAGDNVHGPDLVITAVSASHTAARSIDQYLRGETDKSEPVEEGALTEA